MPGVKLTWYQGGGAPFDLADALDGVAGNNDQAAMVTVRNGEVTLDSGNWPEKDFPHYVKVLSGAA